ncbi:hypothetical protein [Streptomyces avicenniae]|uniref:hypothetical protein n=1 Tax=Streptomyces avicenniae TaxID=500153 RepID=UPI000ABDA0DA|nr:hypothetical protein [Streptomyces avicenniae]
MTRTATTSQDGAPAAPAPPRGDDQESATMRQLREKVREANARSAGNAQLRYDG